MMRSHGWDRDLPSSVQQDMRESYGCSDFDGLYNFYLPGMNVRSTDLQAFIGLRAIDKLDDYSNKRRKNFEVYKNKIKSSLIQIGEREGDFVSSFAIPFVHKRRDDIVRDLMGENIEVRPLIAGNMASKPMWYGRQRKLGRVDGNLENCELLDKFGFYVPNHQDLSESDIEKIMNIINEYE
tara:strand:- start:787 stop:1329 length:543 start_codon:yes stop_codon:yes gene_type:complete